MGRRVFAGFYRRSIKVKDPNFLYLGRETRTSAAAAQLNHCSQTRS